MSFKNYLKEVFSNKYNPELSIDLNDVKIPFVYKEKGLYLNNNRIGNFINNELVIDKNVVDDSMHFDFCIDYFSEIEAKDLIENKVYMIEIPYIDVYDISRSIDSSIDSSGKEYSYIYAEDYELYFDKFSITKLLKKEDLEKIDEKINEKLNKDYKPRYVGTHRTY